MRVLILVTFVLFTSLSFAQKGKSLKGYLKDKEGNPIEMATVIAFVKGSNTIESYSVTNTSGFYKLVLEVNKSYTLKINFLGYKSISEDIDFTEDFGEKNFTLEESETLLNAAELTYEMPVRVVGDSIIYNSDSFKTGSEKNLGDVLKKIPGFEIEEGEILYEGKKPKKLMVENKDFFDGDTKLAAQNIPADAVDDIQVLKNFNEIEGMKKVSDNEDDIALNIKLKDGKKSFWFGELLSGYSVPVVDETESYLIRPKLFYYSPKKSVNFLFNFNNIGEAPLTFSDYLRISGGLKNFRGGGSGIKINSNGAGSLFSSLQGDRAKEISTKFGASNFNFTPNKKTEYSGFLIVNSVVSTSLTQTTLSYNDLDLVLEENVNSNQENVFGIAKFSIKHKPQEEVEWTYDIFGKRSDSKESTDFNSEIASSLTNRKEDSQTLNQNFNYFNTKDPDHIYTISLGQTYEESDPLYNITTNQPISNLLEITKEGDITLNSTNKTSNLGLSGVFNYFLLLNNYNNLQFSIGGALTEKRYNSIIAHQEGSSYINLLDNQFVNDVTYNFRDIYAKVGYKYKKGILMLNPSVNAQRYYRYISQVNSSTVKESLNLILPSFSARFKFDSANTLFLEYQLNSGFPGIEDVSEGYQLESFRRISRGNSSLENSLEHNYSFSYSNFSMFTFINFSFFASYSKHLNKIQSNTIFFGIDNSVISKINAENATESIDIHSRFSKSFRKFKLRVQARANQSSFYNVVNGNPINSSRLTHSYKGTISSSFKNAPNFDIGYNQSYANSTGLFSSTSSPFIKLDIPIGENLIFTSDYTYNKYETSFDNPKASPTTEKYSSFKASVFYQKKGSKWEFILSGTNLDNNNSISIDSYNAATNSTSSTLYYVRPRTVLFSIKYKL